MRCVVLTNHWARCTLLVKVLREQQLAKGRELPAEAITEMIFRGAASPD